MSAKGPRRGGSIVWNAFFRIIVAISTGFVCIFHMLPLVAYMGLSVLMWGIIFHSKSFLFISCAAIISIYGIEGAISYVIEQIVPKYPNGITRKKSGSWWYCLFKATRALRLLMQFSLGGYIFYNYQIGWQWILGGCCIGLGLASLLAGHIYKGFKKITHRLRADNTYTPSRVGEFHTQGLPYGLLKLHFEELSKSDAMAYISEDKNFLSWNTEEFADIQIIKIGEDEWISIFRISSKKYLGKFPITNLLPSQPADIINMIVAAQASGVVIYKKGKMTIYPREYKAIYKDRFMDTLICSEQKFRRWLREYQQ